MKKVLSHHLTLIFALIVFLSWILVQFYFYKSINCASETCSIKLPFFGVLPKSLVESYLASSIDSFIFFLFIGAIALFISLKSPEEEDLLKKINFIFPETKNDQNLLLHIKERVASLACIVTESKRHIDLQDISQCSNFVKVSIKSESQLTNIYHNHDYINNKMTFSIKASPVLGEELWGEVTEASLTSCTKTLPKDHNNLRANKKLTAKKPEYSKNLSIKLKPSQGAIYRTSAWCWQNPNDDFKFKVNRYTKKQSYTVRNSSSNTINFSVKSKKLTIGLAEKVANYVKQYLDKNEVSSVNINKLLDKKKIDADFEKQNESSKSFTLRPSEVAEFECRGVTPDDIVILKIHTKEAKEAKEAKG